MSQKLAWPRSSADPRGGASREDPVARVHALAGRAASTSFEMVGTQKTMEQALLATHRAAPAGRRGVARRDAPVHDPSLLLQQPCSPAARSAAAPAHGRAHADDLYMSGKYKLDEMISRRLPLAS